MDESLSSRRTSRPAVSRAREVRVLAMMALKSSTSLAHSGCARATRANANATARPRAVARRASPMVHELALSDTEALTYGSLALVIGSIGFFVYRAFGSYVFGPSASASHILVKDEARALALKQEIELDVTRGAPLQKAFARVAERDSTCPSAKKGGDLGTFKPGQMVKEFNDVVFNAPVGVVQGPVNTQFGSHLILITARDDA